MSIYIHRGDEQFGPYSTEQAHAYLSSGSLHAEDLAWQEGAVNWMPLAQLLGAPTALPAPAPVAERAEKHLPAWVPARRGDASAPNEAVSPPASAVTSEAPPKRSAATNAVSNAVAASSPAPVNIPPFVPGAPSVGISPAAARTSYPENGFTRAQRSMGIRNMWIGGAWAIGGTAITFFSYEATAGSGGGTYLVTWGAIIFGAIQFLRGLVQFCRA